MNNDPDSDVSPEMPDKTVRPVYSSPGCRIRYPPIREIKFVDIAVTRSDEKPCLKIGKITKCWTRKVKIMQNRRGQPFCSVVRLSQQPYETDCLARLLTQQRYGLLFLGFDMRRLTDLFCNLPRWYYLFLLVQCLALSSFPWCTEYRYRIF